MATQMRAIQVACNGGPDKFVQVMRAVSKPVASAIRVKVAFAGANHVDVYLREAINNYKCELPYVPGKEASGVVEHVPKEFEDQFRVGDQVFGVWPIDGSFAEYALFHPYNLFHLPPQLTMEEGASLGISYFTACYAIKQAETVLGKLNNAHKVFIHGASGSVGSSLVQLLRFMGCEVFGSVGTALGEQLAIDCGCSAVYNHNQISYHQDIIKLHPAGFNVIFEMLADKNLQTDTQLVAQGGVVVVIGSRGSLDFAPRSVMAKQCFITGMTMMQMTQSDMNDAYALVTSAAQAGFCKPIIKTVLTFDHITNLDHALNDNTKYGKVLVTPGISQ